MTEKRYKRLVSSIDYYYCTDNQNENQGLTEKDMLNRLNKQDERIQELLSCNHGLAQKQIRMLDKLTQLEKENENQNNILEDFMVMLNRLQAEPNNEVLQLMAKDMLQMMGKEIMGDVE